MTRDNDSSEVSGGLRIYNRRLDLVLQSEIAQACVKLLTSPERIGSQTVTMVHQTQKLPQGCRSVRIISISVVNILKTSNRNILCNTVWS